MQVPSPGEKRRSEKYEEHTHKKEKYEEKNILTFVKT